MRDQISYPYKATGNIAYIEDEKIEHSELDGIRHAQRDFI